MAAGLGVEPELQFGVACWEAGGTPFLVRKLVEALRQEGIAPVGASAADVHNPATATLGRWAMPRLAHLGPAPARLARAVAVLERADLDQATRLAGLAPVDAVRAAQLLVRHTSPARVAFRCSDLTAAEADAPALLNTSGLSVPPLFRLLGQPGGEPSRRPHRS